jgi:hypothetical protein
MSEHPQHDLKTWFVIDDVDGVEEHGTCRASHDDSHDENRLSSHLPLLEICPR